MQAMGRVLGPDYSTTGSRSDGLAAKVAIRRVVLDETIQVPS
jgi:hypothetical protein